ncbi:MAG: hypothetical protein IPK60_21065 [Sandaracinaceae bacterium]|nr:hypothetical protein [Sandaracinaceae bacterium]
MFSSAVDPLETHSRHAMPQRSTRHRGDGGTDASTDASRVDANELEDASIDAPFDAPVDAHVMDLAIEDSAIDAADDARAVDAGDAGAVWLAGAVEVGATDFVGDVHSVVDASGVLHLSRIATTTCWLHLPSTASSMERSKMEHGTSNKWRVTSRPTSGTKRTLHCLKAFHTSFTKRSPSTRYVVVRESGGWRADESFTFATVAGELRPQRLIASDDHLALFYTVGEQSYLTVKASAAHGHFAAGWECRMGGV